MILLRSSFTNARLCTCRNGLGCLQHKSSSELTVRLLLSQQADVEAQTEKQNTALHIACQKGDESIVKLLLDRRTKIESRYEDEWTALHFTLNTAADRGHLQVDAA